jgi:hypothetical protein
MPDSFEIGPKFYCHGKAPLTNKIFDSIFALGIIVAVATLLLGCCISQIRSGLGRSPHAVSSGGGSIQFNLDEAHFNILGESFDDRCVECTVC